jgi:hypothetical protein
LESGTKVNLSAPTSNSTSMSFNGNASSSLTGTIFICSASLFYDGTGNLVLRHVQIFGWNTTDIVYQDPDNWDETIPAQVGIMQ